MIRSCKALIASVLFPVLTLATPSYAAGKPKAHAIVGTLEKVDGQTMTVHTSKRTEVVTLVPGSRVHKGASQLSDTDLTSYVGQRVKVRYVESGGQKQAQTVTLPSKK